MARYLALTCVLVLLSSCGNRKQARELLDEIQADDYRNTYQRAPDWPELMPSDGPHGDYVDLYINDIMAEAIASGEALDEWPDGSLIVKDGWHDAEGTDLKFISLMEKRGSGTWFWAEYKDDLKPFVVGEDKKACTDCHDAGEDQVLAFGLPEAQ